MKYFNNAGASLASDNVINAEIEYLKLEQRVGAYNAVIEKKEELSSFYQLSAILLNCKPSEIAFVESASKGWNEIIFSLPLSKGDTILTLNSEFGTNLIVLYKFCNVSGCKLEILPTNLDGSLDLNRLEIELEKASGKIAICMSHAVAQGSIVYPVEEIGKLAKKFSAYFVVDACQSVGQLEVDVKKIQCDALVVSGRKWLRGPRGSGILFISQKCDWTPTFIDLGVSDLVLDKNKNIAGLSIEKTTKRFELWERSQVAQLGLAVAIKEHLNTNFKNEKERIVENNKLIREIIFTSEKVIPIGDKNSLTNITGFYFRSNKDLERFKQDAKNENFSLSYMSEWDFPLTYPNGIKNTVRIAPSYFTSEEEFDLLVEFLSREL